MNTFAWFRITPGYSWLLAILVIVGSSPAKAQTQPPLFPIPTQLTFTADSFDVFAGDINGDGTADFAYYTATSTAFTLEVVLNVGSSAATTVPTTLCPANSGPIPQVNFADLNNDKKLDLVFFCNGNLTIQLGNGDGTFQPPANFAANPGTPVFADFNGDGYLDIATQGGPINTPAQVAVYLNHGSGAPGTFAAATHYDAPYSSGLQAGDFNGDGKADLVATMYTTFPTTSAATALVVFYGNGDGTLKAAATQPMANFSSFAVGDFNGDGVTDVALLLISSADQLYTSVQIELGGTSGAFTTGSAVPVLATGSTTSGYGNSLSAASVTTDGNLDLVVTTSVVTIFHGDGKGNFTPAGTYGTGFLGNLLLFADVNGDGKQDMIVGGTASAYFFTGNGDGTFQAPPATPVSGPFADVNNDGIADIVFFPPLYKISLFGVALGRGDGTFTILNQTVPLPAYPNGLITGDFNGDGKIDTLAIRPGTQGSPMGCDEGINSQLLTYLGNGDGTFQQKGTGLTLGVAYPAVGITGDFNNDGKLDVILPYSLRCQEGLVLLPGMGDGTFAAPVLLNVSQSLANPVLVGGDLNNDKKLDLIWGNAVLLGNGDGTFKQMPLNLASSPVVALKDLNGDGVLDAIANPGIAIYAGKGDGTFQTTPFFNQPHLNPNIFASGNVDGSGSPDLLPVLTSPLEGNPILSPYLGDGHGNFTQDTNTYVAGVQGSSPFTAMPVRLNNQAPPVASDNQLDFLVTISQEAGDLYTVSLLNQTNPVPAKPAALTSSTALVATPLTINPGGAVTLTATVVGTNPTGSVTFSVSGTAAGTEPVLNGAGVLQTSFAAAGNYNVTAAYAGDQNNSASTSNAVTVVVASPDFTVAANPGSGSITSGQSATFAFTVSPTGGYAGTVTFSCGALPSLTTCSFSPATVSPSAGSPVTSTLTVTTTAAVAALPSDRPFGPFVPPWIPAAGLAFAGVAGLSLSPRRTKRFGRWVRMLGCGLVLAGLSVSGMGCGGSGNHSPSPGTAAGSYTIAVNASGSGNGPQHITNVTLAVK